MPFSLFLINCLIAMTNGGMNSPDDAALRLFKAEYPLASKRIQDQLKQVRGRGQRVRLIKNVVSPDRLGVPTRDARDFAFHVDHGYQKFSSAELGSSSVENPAVVYCYGNETGFVVSRAPNRAEYSLRRKGGTERDRASFESLFAKFLNAPISVTGSIPLNEWLDRPIGELISAEVINQGGRRIMRLRACWSFNRNDTVDIDLDMDLGWVIRSVSAHLTDRTELAFVAEYSSDRKGWPLPSTIRFVEPDLSTTICTFTTVDFAPTPEREFTLGYYLKRDQGENVPQAALAPPRAAKGESSTLTYWIAGAIVFALIALLCAYRLMRQARSKVVGPT